MDVVLYLHIIIIIVVIEERYKVLNHLQLSLDEIKCEKYVQHKYYI